MDTPALNLPDLPLLQLRLTMRLLVDAPLPEYKGAMIRGGFGYAFQQISCPPPCWKLEHGCELAQLCPFRWIFATPRPPGIEQLHDLQDIPRPFVVEPPTDGRIQYRAGEALEFGLTIIGRAIDYLPYFFASFEQLGKMGLGRTHAPARLERVEALVPWQAVGPVLYQDGRLRAGVDTLPLYSAEIIAAQAKHIPTDLVLTIITPLRLKARGGIVRQFELPALIQAICWRLNTLAIFHGSGAWVVDHRALIADAANIHVMPSMRWLDVRRTSTRGPTPETMPQGGLVGSATLHGVSPAVRTLLLIGTLIHAGKACTFGNGGMRVEA